MVTKIGGFEQNPSVIKVDGDRLYCADHHLDRQVRAYQFKSEL